jgi:hypothetical protein
MCQLFHPKSFRIQRKHLDYIVEIKQNISRNLNTSNRTKSQVQMESDRDQIMEFIHKVLISKDIVNMPKELAQNKSRWSIAQPLPQTFSI